jgi:hypothetical protein
MSTKRQIYRNLETGQKFIQTEDTVSIIKFEHIQETPQDVLVLAHNMNSDKVIIIVKDLEDNDIIPDRIQLEPDRLNTVTIQFNQPITSKITLLFI